MYKEDLQSMGMADRLLRARIIGSDLMFFTPSHNHAALLAGVYLVNGIIAVLIIIYQWAMSNLAEHTKGVVASALIAGSFSVGNIIGSQTFQAKDAPGYYTAKVIVMATQARAAFVTFCCLGIMFRRIRGKRRHRGGWRARVLD